MKVKLSRILSVVLSLILVVSCIVPALQFSTAAATAEESINAIKNAWKGLYEPGQDNIPLFEYFHKKGSSWSVVQPTGIENGIPYYANPDKDSGFIIGGSVFDKSDEGFLLDDYEDVFVYIATSSNIGPTNYTFGFSKEDPGEYGIESENTVKFELSSTDNALIKYSLKNNITNYSSSYTNQKKIGRLHIKTKNTAITKISYVYGSTADKYFELPAGSDSWTLAQWYNAARDLDVSVVTDTEALNAFNVAVSDAREALAATDEGKVTLIVDAMRELTWGDEEVASFVYDKCESSWKKAEDIHSDKVATTEIDGVDITYVDITECRGNEANRRKIVTTPLKNSSNINSPTALDTDDWESIYFYYKTEPNKTVGSILHGGVKQTDGSVSPGAPGTSVSFTAPASTDDAFAKCDLLEILKNKGQEGFFNGDNGENDTIKYYFGRLEINNTENLKAISNFYGKKSFKAKMGFSLAEAAEMSLSDILVAANRLPLDECGGTEALQSFLDELDREADYGAIKLAWKKLVREQPDAGAFPTPSECGNWDLGQWYVAAKAVDLTKYNNSEAKTAFVNEIQNTLNTLYATDKGVAQLIKATWFTVKPAPYTLFGFWYDAKFVYTPVTDANGNPELDANGQPKTRRENKDWKIINRGTANEYCKTVKFDEGNIIVIEPAKARDTIINMAGWLDYNINHTQQICDADGFDELYFYYKSEETYNNNIQVTYCNEKGLVVGADSHTLPAASEWTKFDIKSKIDGNVYYNGESSYFMRVHFTKTPVKAEISSVIAVNTWEKEFGIDLDKTADWGSTEWIVKASDFDFTKYEGGQEMQDLIDALAAQQKSLINHVPVNAYRVEADGTRTELSNEEFGVPESKLLYDDLYEDAVYFEREGKTVELVYNLTKAQQITAVGINTLTKNIKHFKVYASIPEYGVWDEGSLIYEFKANTDEELNTKMLQTLLEVTKMRYVRFAIIDTVDDTFNISEIQIRGARRQEMLYRSLIDSDSVEFSVFTQDKTTDKDNYTVVSHTANRIGSNQNRLKFANINDGDPDTVYDFMIGEKNKESFNILLNMGGQSAVDKISLVNGSEKEYFPTKMNFYISDSEDEIMSQDIEPIYTYTEAAADGIYDATFLAKPAQYVRIEILDNDCDYYTSKDHAYILTVIGELDIRGLDVSGNVHGDAVATFTDEKTQIIAEILALNSSDVFDDITRMSVTERDLTAAEKKSVDSIGMYIAGKLYDITLYDYRGRPTTDIGGRKLRISVPLPKSLKFDSAYWGTFEDGKFTLLEHTMETINDVWYLQYEYTDLSNLLVGVAAYNEYAEDIFPDEPVEDLNNEEDIPVFDYDYEEIQEEEEEEETETNTTKRKKLYKVKKNGDDGFPIWAWFAIGGGVLVLAGGAVATVLIIKKKRKI